MNELKPCPFCGAVKPWLIENGKIRDALRAVKYRVQCLECQASTFYFDKKEDAITAWNTRTEPEARALTWEELKNYNGLPVWVEYWSNRNYKDWFICGEYEWQQGYITDWITINGLQKFSIDEYEKEFICYDRQPKGE